ncbi:glycosyltransferase [Hymenobacter metallicola]|uniref:Glycosyltransferase family 1 protein n=1 Tax=Hymenobacter metallicola TaxID=2563114 RepID=A0A4Z0QF57_9BACT|nr:glycosyltransferase [Hymenobacter metallicola]TGE28667.1 glycosyltransferase family 1 protein [Hymenobacter metallicola]
MHSTLHGRDIVMVGQQPWDTPIGSNAKDIAREFSRHNRVLYVNAPLDRNTLLRQRHAAAVQARVRVLRGQAPGLQAVDANLWVLTPDCLLESINWLPESELYSFCNKVNNRRFARPIRRALRELQFRDFLLFNDNDIFRSFYLKELLEPEVSIYYSRDNMQAVDYWRKHGRRLEPALIAKSDVCVANSSYLAAYCRQYNSRSFDVGQGCDAALLSPPPAAAPPPELRALPRPLLGYVGALVSTRLDLEVLLHISRQRPDWSLVLLGPEDDAFRASALHGQANVHFLGSRPPEQLAAYVQHFDVCLNPQLLNPMTIGNYPRKVDEYLALGKPVVATHTEAMRVFADHTYLAERPEQYVELIARALEEDSARRQAQRRTLAASHTWAHSVEKIGAAVQAVYAQRATHAVLTTQALLHFSQAQA